MKILYGIQGTGNGHITRGRAMAPRLSAAGHEVDFLFSGRPAAQYFDMECFGEYRAFTGLTLKINQGKLDYLGTTVGNSPLKFIADARSLNCQEYDQIITDFEPVTAWAGKNHIMGVLGIGHQYAFQHRIPLAGDNLAGRLVFRYFAPAKQAIGLHWHHFDQPILPPILEATESSADIDETLILVYTPSLSTQGLQELLVHHPDFHFHVYTGVDQPQRQQNVHLLPFSREGFQQDLRTAGGVICNAGFALISEILTLGKKALAIPLHGHMEQLSNAAALQQLNLMQTAPELTPSTLSNWLKQSSATRIRFPDTAEQIVQRLTEGAPLDDMDWIQSVWKLVEYH
ncbi:MAG: MJ1255/VC2487 family glycosyltransferase [Gammaproteobacteria bacterium]